MTGLTEWAAGVDWIKAVRDLGILTVVVLLAVTYFIRSAQKADDHLQESDRTSDAFIQNQLVEQMEKDANARIEEAKADLEQAHAIEDLAESSYEIAREIGKFTEHVGKQIDQVGDEQRIMNRNLERWWTTQLGNSVDITEDPQ